MYKPFIRVFIIALVFSLLLPVSGPVVLGANAQEEAPSDTPTTLVASGVTTHVLKAPKVFWYTGVPVCPPTSGPADGSQPQAQYHELIQRIATYGSPTRTLYDELRDCGQSQVLSNLASDGAYLYWLGPTGLMKLSTDANPGDAPQLMNALVKGYGEVADGGDKVFVLYTNSNNNKQVDYVRKDNNQRVYVSTPGTSGSNLQYDGKYVYYIAAGVLKRVEPGVSGPTNLASGVSGYFPEGSRLVICTINPPQCIFSDNVYVGVGNQIRIYNNKTNTLGAPIYTSVDSTASVYSLLTDFSHLFFFESRQATCNPLCTHIAVLIRATRAGSSPTPIYTYPTPQLYPAPTRLGADGSFLFWQEDGKVLRLPKDAAALPQVNMYVTGMEVTQAVQNTSNSVLLIKGKRTFVRVYVKSTGTAVSGVGAQLSTSSLRVNPLQPVNPAGTKITVRPNPSRNDIDQSFLFELPWSWTQNDSLNLRVDLNPYKVPLEPNYSDNVGLLTVNFANSPSLSVEFFRMNYSIGGTTYSPRYVADVLKTYSWIQRAYPIGGAVGENFKPRLWDVDGGTVLGSLVNQSHPVCALLYGGPKDDPALCASYIANGWLFSYRIQTMMGILNVGLKANAFYYGMISDASGNFPRGQAMYTKTSVGPAGTPGQFFGLGQGWDTDGSYADWYAAHEIGHSLGRAHPNAGSDNPNTSNVTENCGHSRSDPSYPYGNTSTARAPIGPADGSLEGFDVGDSYFGIPKAVLPSSIWNDVMSYCNSQWISDYTYTGMYNNMIAHPSQPTGSAPQAGDFLAASGVINPGANVAGFSYISRLDSVVNAPPLVPGDYSLRLLDNANSVLADYAFTPEDDIHTGTANFAQVVDFVAGTRKVQIVRLSDSAVLASQAVSPNPPSISNVALQGAPNPVSGVVTLNWTASDPDGGALTFDVAYSRDNGASFQPAKTGVSGSSTQLDTASLGGSGTAVLRVTASDGINTAYADSAPFTMADKPPMPLILTPEDGLHIHYGQLVNFSGMALDAQDGTVANPGLTWRNEGNQILGVGALLSLDDLPVGENVISLQATNSVGQSATASVSVFVDDDLSLPGVTLTAGPSPVSWQVPEGSTTLQSADVSINNAGSGSMDWTASEDAAWLSLSAASGTVSASGDPSSLTLTADPSGLASRTTYSAVLTITMPASGSIPEQTVTIPVSLSVGDVYDVVNTKVGGGGLFLPIILH